MKISAREIILLAILLLVGWGYASMTWMINPASDDVAAAQRAVDDVMVQERLVRVKIDALPGLAAQEKEEFDRGAQAAGLYFPDYIEEDIVAFIHELALASGLEVRVITADGVGLRDLDSMLETAARAERDYMTGQLAKAITGEEEEEDEAAPAPARGRSNTYANAAYAYSLKFEFNAGEYSLIPAFFRGFEDLGRFSTVNDVAIQRDGDGTVNEEGEQGGYLSGGFSVNLMAIDPIAPIAPVFDRVELNAPAGKADPFAPAY